MPEYFAPGVYVEELTGGARPIRAVDTSTTAFFGCAPNPAANLRSPTPVTSMLEFRRQFVSDTNDAQGSNFATAVEGFFINGGRRLYVINLGMDAEKLTTDDAALIDTYDGISLVAAPGFTDQESHEVLLSHCELRGDRFAVLDADQELGSLSDLTQSKANGGTRPRSTDRGVAAVYVPWIEVTDALTRERVVCPPSGHICGLYATVDSKRGVHKAPANEILRGALGVSRAISDAEQAILYPVGVNCIRVLESGIRVWGARTLADSSSEYRYIAVRRLVTMIAQSIEQGTGWVVFEPNDSTLWKSLRRDIGNFLNTLWRNGALMGTTPDQAYFVKCDRDTTTQTDIDDGRVIVEIGIATIKPAEYLIIRIVLSTNSSFTEDA